MKRVKRSASVQAAVARSREARLYAIERRLLRRLRYLRRHDRPGYDAIVTLIKRLAHTLQ